MPLVKRKFAPRRRLIRKRTMMPRRRLAIRRPITPVHSFKRTWYSENYFSTGTTGSTLAGLSFNLNQMPNATEFSNLYDAYRINRIVVKIIPKITEVGGILGSASNSMNVSLHSAVDYDDSHAPTGISDLVQYSTYKMTRGNQIHTRVFTPRVELSANATSNAAPKAYQWLDTADLSLAHLGMKLYIPFISASTVIYYDYSVTMYFSCKNPK